MVLDVYKKKFDIYCNGDIDNKLLEITDVLLTNSNRVIEKEIKLVKDDIGRQVFKVKIGNDNYYLKKYFYKKASKKIKNLFRPAEAVRAYQISNKLLAASISVAEPIAAIVNNKGFMVKESIFITKEFVGIKLDDYLINEEYNKSLKEKIIKEVAKLWAKLYLFNFLNGDPNLPGILVRVQDDKVDLCLVDMDNFKQYSYLSWKKICKNLIEFNAHSYSGLGISGINKLSNKDRIIFFKLIISELIKEYGWNINLEDNISYINKKTIERLIKWGREEVITQSNNL